MLRRNFFGAAAAASLGAAPSFAAGKNAWFEVRYYRLRNSGNQIQRTNDYLSKHWMPAAKRAGAGAMGFFGSLIAEQGPFAMSVVSFPSLAAYEGAMEKMMADKEFAKGYEEYNVDLPYIRMESSLLRGFDTLPDIVVPEAKAAPRVFELRIYESNNLKAGKRKIRMFDEGEIGIFKRLGMAPVFFGETVVGTHMPNLVYLLAFDDLAHREKAWRAFGADPEWQKMRAMPGVSDPEIVSNISNAMLRPLPFSPIK